MSNETPRDGLASKVPLWGIFLLLLGAALYVTRNLVLPIAFAALASLVLAPVVRALGRARIPPPVAAAGLLVLLLGASGYGVAALSAPAAEWVKRAPEGVREVERKLSFLRDPVEQVNRATEQVERVLPGADDERAVVVQPRRLSGALFDQTQGFVSGVLVMAVLLLFLLSSPDGFLERAVEIAPTLEDKKRIVSAAREIQGEVSSYLLTMSAINAVFGLLVWASMWALGVPNAALWGAFAALTNFVPYVGALVMTFVLAGVGILSFETPWQMFLPAAAFLALNVLEANVVTPLVMGRRLTLNPVVVFVWVILWSWLWGIPGGLIAVPMLSAVKIAFQHVPSLVPLAHLLD